MRLMPESLLVWWVRKGSTSACQPTLLAVRYAALCCRSALEWRVHVNQPSPARADWTSVVGHNRKFAKGRSEGGC
jgi:hypothetical protein